MSTTKKTSGKPVFKNKKETIGYYKSTVGQVAGKADMRNRKISVAMIGEQVMVNEQCDFFVFGGLLVFIIRSWGGYPDAVAFSVLLVNILVPLIDSCSRPAIYGK